MIAVESAIVRRCSGGSIHRRFKVYYELGGAAASTVGQCPFR